MQFSTHFPGNRQSETNRYDVYVNQDFIGEKKIYSRNENIYVLEDFLEEQGIFPSDSRLEGHHFYFVETDLEVERLMKEALHLHLSSD